MLEPGPVLHAHNKTTVRLHTQNKKHDKTLLYINFKLIKGSEFVNLEAIDLLMFDCPVLATLAQPGCVVEVASCDRLTSKQRTKISLMDLYSQYRHEQAKAIGEENYFISVRA